MRSDRRRRTVGITTTELVLVMVLAVLFVLGGWFLFGRQVRKLYCYAGHTIMGDDNHECDPNAPAGGGGAVEASGKLVAASAGARQGAGNGSLPLRNLARSATDEACFVAGTAVWTDSGPRAIESIAVGDRVWSRDPESGARSLRTIVDTIVHRDRGLVRVTLGDSDGAVEALWVTPEHPFFVDGRGFIHAGHLEPGALVDGIDDRPLRVVAVEERPERADVFNLEVETLHTYFAGRLGALVHNAYPDEPGGAPVSYGQLLMQVSQLNRAKSEWMDKVNGTADGLRARLEAAEKKLDTIDASIPGTVPTRDQPVTWSGADELGQLKAQLAEVRKVQAELKAAEQTITEPAALRGQLQTLLQQLAPPDPNAPPLPGQPPPGAGGALPPLSDEQRQTLLQQLGLPPNALDPTVPPPARNPVAWDLESLAQVRLVMLQDKPAALQKRIAAIEARIKAAETRIATTNRALRVDLDKPADQALVDRDAGVIIRNWLNGNLDGKAVVVELENLVKRYAPDGDANTAAQIRLRFVVQREQRLGDVLTRIGLGTLERPDQPAWVSERQLLDEMAATVLRVRPELKGLNGALYKKMLVEAMRPHYEALKKAGATVDADGRWNLKGALLSPKALADDKLRTALTYFFGPELVVKLADPKRSQVMVIGPWAIPPGDMVARPFTQWQKEVQDWLDRFRDRDLPAYLSSVERANHWIPSTKGIYLRAASEKSPAELLVDGNFMAMIGDVRAVEKLGAPPETIKQLLAVLQQATKYEKQAIDALQGEITKVKWVCITAPAAPLTMFLAPAATPFIALGFVTAGATAGIKTAIQIHYGDGQSSAGEIFYNNIVMDGSGAIITAPLALLGPAAGRVAQLGGAGAFTVQQVSMWTNVGVGVGMSGKSLVDAGKGYAQAYTTLEQADALEKNATTEGERWMARQLRAQAWSTVTDSTSALGWGLFGAKASLDGGRNTLAYRQQMIQMRNLFEPLLLKAIDPSLKPGAKLPEVEAAIKAQRLSGKPGGREVDAAFEMLSRMHEFFGDPAWMKSSWHPIVVEARVVETKTVPSTSRALVPVGKPALPAPVEAPAPKTAERPMLPAAASPAMLPAPRGPPATPSDLRGGDPAKVATVDDAQPIVRYSRAEVRALAERSSTQLADRSTTTLATLRADPAAREIDRLQVGGGLAVAAVDGKTFLVDMRGRWPADNSGEIFQSARELRTGFVDAGLDDPVRYVAEPDQLVPLDAVTRICDMRALTAKGYVQARAEVVGYSDGKWTVRLQPTDGSAPVDVRVKELQVATGLGPISVPVESGKWNAMRTAGKAWFGDEVVSTKFTVADAQKIDTMIIIGVGGTAISTAKSYLQLNPRGRVIFVGRDVNIRAWENTSGAADFNERFLDRVEFYLKGRADYALVDGKVTFNPPDGMQRMTMSWVDGQAKLTPVAGAMPATVRGDALVTAIVRDADRLPDPVGGFLGDAYQKGTLGGAAMFDGQGRYLGYRITTPDGAQLDVIGASGRVVPTRLNFQEQSLAPALVQSVIDYALANPSQMQQQAVDALRGRGVDVDLAELTRIWQRHDLATPGQRRGAAAKAAAGTTIKARPMLTRASERELIERESVGIERVMLGRGNFAVGAGGSAVTAAAYRRAVTEPAASSSPLVVSTTPAGGVRISGSVMHRLVGYDVIVDRGIVLFSRADGGLRLASLAQVDAARPGIYSLTLHGDGEGGAYFNAIVDGKAVARPVRIDALVAKVKRIVGRDAKIDGIYLGACDSPALLAQVARETGKWAFGPAGREAVTLSADGRTVTMTVYDAEGRPLPANRAYVLIDAEGRQTFVEDPTQFFEPSKVRYDATRPLSGAAGMRAPAVPPAGPVGASTPATSPKTPFMVLQIPGSLGGPGSFPKFRDAFGTPEIAEKANANFATAAQLDVHGQFVNGTDLTAFQGYLDRLYANSPAWRARVDAVAPPSYVKTQALQAHEIVASFWKKGFTGISDPRQQLALEAYLYWAIDEQLPALKKAGNPPDGVMLNVFSQSNLAVMELMSRVAAKDLRTPGGVRLAEQRIVINGVAPAVGFQSLRAAIFKMAPLPDKWTITFFQTADRATHIQHLIGTFAEIFFQPELTTAMRKAPTRPNVRVVELAWPFNPRGAVWNPRHKYDVTFAQFIDWLGGDAGAKLLWSALLTGESPLTIEAASGMGSWIKLADSNGRAIDFAQATKAMAARLQADPEYRKIYNARLLAAKAVIARALEQHMDDPKLQKELKGIELWDEAVILQLKAVHAWTEAIWIDFYRQRQTPAPTATAPTAPPPRPQAPPTAPPPAQKQSRAEPGDGGKLLPLPSGRSLSALLSAVGPDETRQASMDSLQDGVRAAARAIATAPAGGGGRGLRLDRIFVDDQKQARFVGGVAGGGDGLRALVAAVDAASGLRDAERTRLVRAATNEFSRAAGVDATSLLARAVP